MRMAKVLLKTKIYYQGRIRPEGSIVNYDIDTFNGKLPKWCAGVLPSGTDERKGEPVVKEQKTTTLHEIANTTVNLSKPTTSDAEVPEAKAEEAKTEDSKVEEWGIPAVEQPGETANVN